MKECKGIKKDNCKPLKKECKPTSECKPVKQDKECKPCRPCKPCKP